MTGLQLPYADLGELIVSIVAVVVATVTGGFAFVALWQSRRANSLATDANQLARKANRQAEEFFEAEGPRASVALRSSDEGLAAVVRSVGRLEVIIEDVLVNLAETDVQLSLREIFIKRGDYPVTLRPSETFEQLVSPYLLAAASQRYGGCHSWKAAPVVSGEPALWSDPCEVAHPGEPTLEEQLADFNSSRLDSFRRRLQADDLSAEETDALRATYAELGADLRRLRARYDESARSMRQGVTTMLVNAERNYAEAGEKLRG